MGIRVFVLATVMLEGERLVLVTATLEDTGDLWAMLQQRVFVRSTQDQGHSILRIRTSQMRCVQSGSLGCCWLRSDGFVPDDFVPLLSGS
jgi:hypothetical protein